MHKDDRSLFSKLNLFSVFILIALGLFALVVADRVLGTLSTVSAVSALGCLAGAIRLRRSSKTLAAIPSVLIGNAKAGYIEICGRAEPADNGTLLDPLAHQPCLCFEVEIEKLQRSFINSYTHWTYATGASSSRPFLLRDHTGSCVVMPEGAQFSLPVARRVRHDFETRHVMSRIRPGDFVVVIGDFSPASSHSKRIIRSPPSGQRFSISNRRVRGAVLRRAVAAWVLLLGFLASSGAVLKFAGVMQQ